MKYVIEAANTKNTLGSGAYDELAMIQSLYLNTFVWLVILWSMPLGPLQKKADL